MSKQATAYLANQLGFWQDQELRDTYIPGILQIGLNLREPFARCGSKLREKLERLGEMEKNPEHFGLAEYLTLNHPMFTIISFKKVFVNGSQKLFSEFYDVH